MLEVSRQLTVKTTGSCVTEEFVRGQILGEANRIRICQELEQFQHKLHRSFDNRKRSKAGVLIPLCIVDNHLSLLYTLRSAYLSAHAHQMSFPGGKMDKGDRDEVDTALRETKEELGIPTEQIEVWTQLKPFPQRMGQSTITPVLGYIGNIDVESLRTSQSEVDKVITVPILSLLNPSFHGYTHYQNDLCYPVFHPMKLNYMTRSQKIWGITAVLTDIFLAKTFPDIYQSTLEISKT